MVVIPDNAVGVVTTLEGKPLAEGQIAGKIIEGHNKFQDIDGFLSSEGYKGLQEQVILAGSISWIRGLQKLKWCIWRKFLSDTLV